MYTCVNSDFLYYHCKFGGFFLIIYTNNSIKTVKMWNNILKLCCLIFLWKLEVLFQNFLMNSSNEQHLFEI